MINWVLRDVIRSALLRTDTGHCRHTGAGKTTLTRSCLRFYDIQQGEILLDGVSIRRYDVHDLRANSVSSLQDPFLFTGTLETNVRLGNEELTKARRGRPARSGTRSSSEHIGGKHQDKRKRAGPTFSVGQRQLISFARATRAQVEVPDPG